MLSTLSTGFNGLNKIRTVSNVATTWSQLSSQAFMIAQPQQSTTYTTTQSTSYGTSTVSYTNASVSTQIRKTGYYTFYNTGGSILFTFPTGLTQMNSGFSVCFWINISNSSTAYTLALLPSPSSYKWAFGIQTTSSTNSGKLTVSTQYPNSSSTTYTNVYENTKFTATTWIFYTITYNNQTGEVSLYKNGNLEMQNIQYPGMTNSNWFSNWGMYNINQVYWFDGVYCWNKVLTASEVALAYANV